MCKLIKEVLTNLCICMDFQPIKDESIKDEIQCILKFGQQIIKS